MLGIVRPVIAVATLNEDFLAPLNGAIHSYRCDEQRFDAFGIGSFRKAGRMRIFFVEATSDFRDSILDFHKSREGLLFPPLEKGVKPSFKLGAEVPLTFHYVSNEHTE